MSSRYALNVRFLPRSTKLTAAGAALATAAGLLVSAASPSAALEQITSGDTVGDFETVGLTPQGWNVTAPDPNRGVVSTSRAISGTRSLLVEDTSTTAPVSVSRARFYVTPGTTYHAQGYAYSTKGFQSLSLVFYDASGAVVGRSTTPTTGATMVWSRVETHAAAPATATTASIEVSSASASLSQAWWDGVYAIAPAVGNSSFETAPTSTAPVPGWTTAVSGGASLAVTTAQARLGTKSLQVSDATTAGATNVTSALTPVFPNVTHDVRAWVRPTAGSLALTVRWYDRDKSLISTRSVPVAKPLNTWSLASFQATAPSNGAFAAVQVGTTIAGTGSGAWDVAGITPTSGAPVLSYASTGNGEPLDAFNNSNTSGTTVIGGRAKVFTVISGFPSEFQLADLETGKVEVRLPAEGMEVGWGMTVGRDGSIYLGGGGGHLYRYVPGASALTDLGKVTASATTVWDLETGPDGRIWGVSYPKSELWNYDPAAGKVTSLGTVSASHDYARSLAVDGTYAYVGLGSTNPTLMRVALANPASKTQIPFPTSVTAGNVSELELLGRYLEVRTPSGTTSGGTAVASERRLYDTRTGSWDVAANMAAQTPSPLDSKGNFYYLSYKQLWAVDADTGVKTSVAATTMAAGRDRLVVHATLGGVTDDWLLAYDPAGSVAAKGLTTFKELSFGLSFLPTKMRIKSLDSGPNGALYAGGFGGSSLTVVDPATGTRNQYPSTSATATSNSLGEVEGTTANGRFQYIGTYTDGKVFRYDTTQPWVDGTNPKLISVLGPTYKQDRPLAWASAGTRTFFGTIPKYGVLGGALGIIDNETATPRIVSEPVTDQSVVSLAASGNVVYGGTSRWGGLGINPTQPSAKLFAYDASTNRKLWEVAPQAGVEAFGAVAMGPTGTLWAASGPLLFELDPRNGQVLRKVMVYPAPPTTGAVYRNADIVFAGGLIYLAAMDKVYAVDPSTLRVTAAVPSGVSTPRLAVSGSRIYYAAGTQLRSIAWQ
ncbi:MAG TPA: hypothetical protein VFJ94_15025 [Intrasporangium sp.]|uniref:hypothetical protein n=1 Tax=Intrasporangium sp. TaxID=1925024 RepID=UPI002D76BAC9|nr:hypothetical protein [Intrasporangium sp.]HET7399828.1 hypothetical protein [Intrasporangium sp.]